MQKCRSGSLLASKWLDVSNTLVISVHVCIKSSTSTISYAELLRRNAEIDLRRRKGGGRGIIHLLLVVPLEKEKAKRSSNNVVHVYNVTLSGALQSRGIYSS